MSELAHPVPTAGRLRAGMAVAALGVVYGDIGTSPLYTLRECLNSLALEPTTALARLGAALADSSPEPAASDEDWLASWRSADERAAEAIVGVLADDQLTEPRVAAELGVLAPAEATLFVASSMPVRDIETFWPVRADPPRVLCNRGANGIDGMPSNATSRWNVIASIAPSAAPLDTPSVSGVASGLRSRA